MRSSTQPAKSLSSKQVSQLAKEAAKKPTQSPVTSVSSSGGTVRVSHGKVVKNPA